MGVHDIGGYVDRIDTVQTAGVFERQATVLAETIHAAYNDLVKISDFSELKEILGRPCAGP